MRKRIEKPDLIYSHIKPTSRLSIGDDAADTHVLLTGLVRSRMWSIPLMDALGEVDHHRQQPWVEAPVHKRPQRVTGHRL